MLTKMATMDKLKGNINWRAASRFLARVCDYGFLFLTLSTISLFLPFFYEPYFYSLLALATPLLWAPLEALCLTKWKTTPGKALLKITVTDKQGQNLSYPAAFRRALFLPKRPGEVHFRELSWKRKVIVLATSSVLFLSGVYWQGLALWSVGLEKGVPIERWVQYSSSDVGFKVSFPTEPAHESKELVIPDTGKVLSYKEITSLEKKKVSYSLTHMELPRKWRFAGNTTLLKGVLDVVVKYAEGAELLEKEFTVHQGLRALDFRMKQGDQEVKGRLIISGGILYKLTIEYPSALATEMQSNPFISSFELT